MKLTFLKKFFGWKSVTVFSVLALMTLITNTAFAIIWVPLYTLLLILLFLHVIYTLTPVSQFAQPVTLDIDPLPTTNAAVFNVNWTKENETMNPDGKTVRIPGGHYQLSLPFSDYTRNGKAIKAANHFHLTSGFHFGMPLLSETEKGKASNDSFALSFTPVANNQQQLAESTQWLSTEENMPISTLSASKTDGMVRLYKPISLKRDNQIIATINSMVIETNQVEQGNTVNLSLEGVYGVVKTKEKNANFGPGHFSYAFNDLNATLMHELEKEVQDIQHLSKNKQILLQMKMVKQVHELCQNGSTMTVTYDTNTVTGPVKKQYTIALADLIKAPVQFAGPMPVDLGLIFAGK